MPRGDSDPSRKEKEESGWRHTRRHRLRTLLQRAFRSGGSPPAMSSNCICIAVPLNRRWCSHSAWGQECWQIISQWVWNLRLELGHQLEPTPLLTTEFAPAISTPQAACHLNSLTPSHFCLWIWSTRHGYPPRKAGRFTGADFPLQPDGTLQCPAGHALHRQERRREADGSLRVVYAACLRDCRPCPLRVQCQWEGHETRKPRPV